MKVGASHPYIEKRRDHRGGRAIIVGTNFPVSSVVNYVLKIGMLPEQLVRTFSHLTLAQVYDALSYYYDHQDEIDAEIMRNQSEDDLSNELPGDEILRFHYDPSTGDFVVSRIMR